MIRELPMNSLLAPEISFFSLFFENEKICFIHFLLSNILQFNNHLCKNEFFNQNL